MPIYEVAYNNHIPAFHSSGKSRCTVLILCGRSYKSFIALFVEDFDTRSEYVIGAAILWGLLPFERQKCSVSLWLKHGVFAVYSFAMLNLSYANFPVCCIWLFDTASLTKDFFLQNFQLHLFHAAYFAKASQMNTLCSTANIPHTHKLPALYEAQNMPLLPLYVSTLLQQSELVFPFAWRHNV
jgi:hypothetical protein